MSVSIRKALVELTDRELRTHLSEIGRKLGGGNYAYNDILNEIERRRIGREARRSFWLSFAALLIAALSFIASLASVLVALFRGGK